MNQSQKKNSLNEIRKFIIKWNNNYPFDYIWRKKFGVAFGSTDHRQMSFFDMIFELEEEKMMNNLSNQKQLEVELQKEKDFGITDEEFENLDLSKFD